MSKCICNMIQMWLHSLNNTPSQKFTFCSNATDTYVGHFGYLEKRYKSKLLLLLLWIHTYVGQFGWKPFVALSFLWHLLFKTNREEVNDNDRKWYAGCFLKLSEILHTGKQHWLQFNEENQVWPLGNTESLVICTLISPSISHLSVGMW